jgi:hypothetical protein
LIGFTKYFVIFVGNLELYGGQELEVSACIVVAVLFLPLESDFPVMMLAAIQKGLLDMWCY